MDYQDEYNQMMRENNSSQENFRYVVIAVIAFVLGFGAAWLSFKNQNSDALVVENNKTEVEIGEKDASENSGEKKVAKVPVGVVGLEVLDQAPGKTVFVKDLKADIPVWVVIVENINGIKGNILGAGLFNVGDNAGVVELLRGTVEGGNYYAVLHIEDSNLEQNRTFDLAKDVPLVDSKGNLAEVIFKTSSIPEAN